MTTVDEALAAWRDAYGEIEILGEDADLDPNTWTDVCTTLAAAYDAHIAGPRTWTLPPEPGPEVTAVRATQALYGFTLWQREGHDGWVLRRRDGVKLCIVGTWLRLLERFGPVTDATGEQP